MSRTGCQISGQHDWRVVLDDDGWLPVAVVCGDWECDGHFDIKPPPLTTERDGAEVIHSGQPNGNDRSASSGGAS